MTDTKGVTHPRKSEQKPVSFQKSRRILLQFLIICAPLWLSIKIYNGPYGDTIHFLAGILAVINVALIVQLIRPGLREDMLLIALFLIFSAVELIGLQYPDLFASIRFSIAGQTIIGDAFSINKIPYYGVGAFIGYFVLKACRLK